MAMQVGLGHIGLNVTNLEVSLAFYESVFGFATLTKVSEGERKYAFLGDEQGVVLTLWQQSKGSFNPQLPGLHHLAFQVSSVEEVIAFEKKLALLNISLIYDGIVAHGERVDSGGLYFTDPDGIRLEVFTANGVQGHSHADTDGPACGFF
jgi:lactoylglutathione lyase